MIPERSKCRHASLPTWTIQFVNGGPFIIGRTAPPHASRPPGPSTRPTPSWIGGASSSAMLMGRRSLTSIFEGELDRRSAAHLLTRDEARPNAANAPKLLEMLRRSPELSEA